MRYLLSFCAAIVSIYSSAAPISVRGVLKNNHYQDSVTLTEFASVNPVSQTVKIGKDGEFAFSVDATGANFYRIVLDERNFLVLVLVPGDKVQVTADAADLSKNFTIKGSTQSEQYHKATKQFTIFANVRDSLALVNKKQNEELTKAETDYAREYISKNINSLTALLFIDKLPLEEYTDVYTRLDSSLQVNFPGNPIVKDFHADLQKMSGTKIGFPVGEIILNNAQGVPIALSSLRGKVVLIDFWATWCMPCKAEIPNIKRAYAAYKQRGFEVYSISLDRDKNRWLAEEPNLPWINVLDEAGVYADRFSVQSIPFTLLIDREGRIVAKNVRGPELEDRLKALLD